MRIARLAAAGFGRLQDWSSPELGEGLVVFYGRNEAGKSTLLNLIGTVLYGFSPATRANHPYVPWGSSAAACFAELALSSGGRLTVHRSLRSRPSGKLLTGSLSQSIGNQPLSLLGSLPREVFFEVYALTLDQLRFPQGEVWEVLQDQLLGGQFGSYLRPISEVLSELESEANSLWRPDRRGKPRARELQAELKQLRELRSQALNNEEKLRGAQAELIELQSQLQQLLDDKTRVTIELEQAERLLPVHQAIERIQQLEQQASSIGDCGDLPYNPLECLKQLEEQLTSLEQQISGQQAELHELQEQQALFSQTDKSVLARREQIQLLTRGYGMVETDQRALHDTELRLTTIKERLADRARLVLRGGWQPGCAEVVLDVDEAELRASLQRLKSVENDIQQLEARCAGAESRHLASATSKGQLMAAGLLLLVGLLSYWLVDSASDFKLLTVALVAGGLGMLLSGLLRYGSSGATDLQTLKDHLAQLRQNRLELLVTLRHVLQGLPVAAQRLETPDDSLLVDICALKELVQDLQQSEGEYSTAASRLAQTRRQCQSILEQCDLNSSGNLLRDINLLESALEQARLNYQRAQKASEALAAAEKRLAELQAEHAHTEAKLKGLQAQLEQLPGSTLADKAASLADCRRSAQLAAQLRAELELQYPDYPQLVRQLSVLRAEQRLAEISQEAIARRKIRLEQIQEEIDRVNAAVSALGTEIRLGMEQQRVADLEGELVGLELQLSAVKRRRDQLALLHKLVRAAERRFKEQHQPDILRRAERHLALITAGRYSRLYLDQQAHYLQAGCRGSDEPVAVKEYAFSRGTLEQIYLALRLALAEHLDPDGEPLPLLLDEALVNWDSSRLQRGLEVLHQVAAERQILLFTCHRWLVEQIEPQTQVVEVL